MRGSPGAFQGPGGMDYRDWDKVMWRLPGASAMSFGSPQRLYLMDEFSGPWPVHRRT